MNNYSNNRIVFIENKGGAGMKRPSLS